MDSRRCRGFSNIFEIFSIQRKRSVGKTYSQYQTWIVNQSIPPMFILNDSDFEVQTKRNLW